MQLALSRLTSCATSPLHSRILGLYIAYELSSVLGTQEEFISTVWDQQQHSGPNSISPDSIYQQEAPIHTPSLPSQYSSQSSADYRCSIWPCRRRSASLCPRESGLFLGAGRGYSKAVQKAAALLRLCRTCQIYHTRNWSDFRLLQGSG